LSLGRLEVGHGGHVDHAEFDSSFGTGKHLPLIVVLDGAEFLRAVDRFVMENAVQLESQVESRDIEVEFGINGIGSVEVKLKVGEQTRQLFLEPSLHLGDSGSLSFVGIVPFGGAGLRAEVVS
jgi:hypothetical protein